MGTQNGHNMPFLESASLKKRKTNVMKRIKQFYKYLKRAGMWALQSMVTSFYLRDVTHLSMDMLFR